jgi:glycerophosphocholine phosphodiesterase GPCPD1
VNVWEFPLSLSHLEEVNYRYLVCSELNWRGEKKLIVEQFESTIHPRKFVSSSTAVKGSVPVVVEDGEFGTTRRGEHSVDEGWLEHVSELQLRLHSSTEPGVRLEGELKDEEIKIRVSTLCHQECKQLSSKMKVLDVTTGDCHLFEEEELVPYRCGSVVVFTARSPDFSNCAVLVDIFSGKDGEFLGRSSILPQHLKDDGGRLTLTISNKELLPVGVLQFDYLVIYPIDHHHIHNLSKVFCSYWNRKRRTLDIGHRGSGNSFDPSKPEELKPTATENTIASLREAGLNGADFVEFDVQLTADLIPVVFHDFFVCTTLSRKSVENGELCPVKVRDLTLRQLRSLKLAHHSAIDGKTSSQGFLSDFSDSDSDYSLHKEEDEDAPEKKTFPLLRDLLKRLPKSLGFNIEMKYPSPTMDGMECFPYFDRNLMADIVLKTVFKYARDRRIIFSCFDPDMCTVLRLKQPRYPVLLLARTEAYRAHGRNIRTRTLNAGISFVKSQKLLGIVPYSNMFLEKTELIKSVKDQGLVLLSWGERNNVAENIAIQKKLGVDGIIYDGISHFKPSTRDDMIKKGVERIAQSVQAHQPRLTTEVLEEEENEEQGETSSSVASQHVMAAITEDPEPSGD